MPSVLKYEATPTFRDLSGRFTRANAELLREQREWVKDEGRRFTTIAQRNAPKGKTKKFSAGIRWRSFGGGDSLGFTASVPQPLGKWIIGGTKPHTITARNVRFLRFVIDGKAIYTYKVSHPGTKPNPFIQESYDEWLPGAEMTFRRISTRWVTTVSGG